MYKSGNSRFFACLGLICIIGAIPPSLAQSDTTPPVKIKELSRQITVLPDGSSIITSHNEFQLLKETMIASLAQQSLQYVESTQTLDIAEAYTLKPDGKKLPVAASAILTQMAPRKDASPLYSDLKAKVIIFPNVEVGDTLVYTTVMRTKPVFPGQFTYDTLVPPTLYIDSTSTTVTTPQAMPLTVEAVQLTAETTKGADSTTYGIHYSNAKPVSDDNVPLARFDRSPRFSLSSFPSYDALAGAYAALAEPKLVVTGAIQAKADEITAGATGRRERVEKIYNWVSSHIRYVAVEFGLGSIVPHDADSVLANGYGDCKDHAALFTALLKAKNIRSNLVLVNSSNAYTVAKVPTLGAFNHVITWIPDLKIYADTTARTPPFGFLPRSEYGKPALHIGDAARALHSIPLLTADQVLVRYAATDTLDDEGRVTGTNMTAGTGAFAGVLRGLASFLQGDENNKFIAGLLTSHGFPRATASYSTPPTTDLGSIYTVTGHYTTPGGMRAVKEQSPFTPPNALHFVFATGTLLLDAIADEKNKAATALPCSSARLIEDYTLEFPTRYQLVAHPSDVTVKSPHFAYSSHWSVKAQALTVHREFSASFSEAVCLAPTIQEAQTSLAKIREDSLAKITLSRR